MEKIHDWLLDIMGTDGMAHCLLSATITAILGCFLPWYGAVIGTLLVGLAKEVYDKYSGKGNAEIKDLVCDLIGIIIGAL
ncbi:MAG: hypothetical protein J6C15_05555 [Bacteroidaceae bacterium]|nr:hypothetical protein [Bacteroidaceae bacterium]